MLVIRETFTAKPGQASKLAKLFLKVFGEDKTARVMTDLVGDYNTVVIERQVKNLEEYEKQMEEYSSGKMDPDIAKEMAHYTEMYMKGRREIFKIVE
ncbi:hypothetical protein C4573_06050 [Candidatus Woesearchaeota archaeon]|nr:MAG: hypothetical protein C4573_06050 [Candidatus Woesearchaeota archaeon]